MPLLRDIPALIMVARGMSHGRHMRIPPRFPHAPVAPAGARHEHPCPGEDDYRRHQPRDHSSRAGQCLHSGMACNGRAT